MTMPQMSRTQAMTIDLPSHLYRQLNKMAETSQRPLQEVVIQSLKTGTPPNLEHVPVRFQVDLQLLTRMDDALLWQITKTDLSEDHIELYESLLYKNQDARLSSTEQKRLERLREESDVLMFRRAYAYALLKWRGHRIPNLS